MNAHSSHHANCHCPPQLRRRPEPTIAVRPGSNVARILLAYNLTRFAGSMRVGLEDRAGIARPCGSLHAAIALDSRWRRWCRIEASAVELLEARLYSAGAV